MSLYKYVTVNTLKKVIAGSIRFSQPGSFNDPYELLPEIYVDPNRAEENQAEFRFCLLSERRTPAIGLLEDDFLSDHCNDIKAREFREELDKKIGILCLSKNENSLLMWAHYAQEYAGAKIEFDETHEFFQGQQAVTYTKNRPKLDFFALADGGLIPVAEFCFKSEDWAYEREIRVVRNLHDCRKVVNHPPHSIFVGDIPLEAIKSVTFGERMALDDQKFVLNELAETHVAINLAAVANWKYGFRVEPIKFDKPLSELPPIISPRTAELFLEGGGELAELAEFQRSRPQFKHVVNKRA